MWRTPGEQRRTLEHDGRTRDLLIHVPPRADDRPLPLIVVFHGGGGTAVLAKHATGWSEKADREGFVVAYPEAVRKRHNERPSFTHNPQLWNAAAGLGYAERVGIDDIGFAAALLASAVESGAIDANRIFGVGFSNGASMALRAVAALSSRFAAVAAVCGHLWDLERRPAEPVPLLYIAGAKDRLNPIEGGIVTTPWRNTLNRPPPHRTALTWAEWCGCPLEPSAHTNSAGVEFRRYGDAAERSVVEYHVLAELGHHWPGGRSVMNERYAGPMLTSFDATAVIWEFFQAHPRAGRSR